MKRIPLLLPLLLLIMLPAAGVSAEDFAPREFAEVQRGFTQSGETVLPYAPDRIIIKLKKESMPGLRPMLNAGAEGEAASLGISSLDAIGKDAGATRVSRTHIEPADRIAAERLGTGRWFTVHLEGPGDIPELVERYAADPNVEYAKPDWRAFPAVAPGDPLYPDHWGHNNTAQLPSYDWNTHTHTGPLVGTVGFDANAEAAWDAAQGYGSSSVVIAILDSGVDIDHPDLNLVAGYDFGDNDSNPDDNSGAAGHGTCCAGVAASVADNNRGAAGAAPGCVIMPCKIADSGGSMYFSYIENALYWAADNGADVISMSIGAYISSDPATDAAIEYAYNHGCVILAATSNDNDNVLSYPANHANVIGVGAASPCGDRKRSSSSRFEVNSGVSTDPNGYTCDGERWWGSNWGTNTPDAAGAVDVIAPTILPTTDIGGSGGYQSGDYEPFFNGTSCATPYAAGVCGLIKSANPAWTPAQVRDQLVNTATDVVNVESVTGWDMYSGYGMVDAAAAVGGGGPVAPVAAFTGTPTSGYEPLTVNFTDQSSGSPTSWSWDFGDGGTSTAQNPSYTYNTAGTYTVTLTVTNTAGSDDEIKSNYITVTTPPPPVAQFSGTPTSGYEPLTVNFTDESTNNPTSWSWDFGDGSGTSTAQNPSYTYNTAGTYTVTLTAYNAYGSDVEQKVDFITVTTPPPPVAQFSGSPTSGTVPLTVSFTDQSTNNPTSWSWDFGDGGTSTAQNPAYTYNATGTYTVTLTAYNAYGSDVEQKVDYITVSEQGVSEKSYATLETPVTGTVSGDYTATLASDDVRESITEVLYTGHPRKTYSYLEHRWTFSVPSGSSSTTFYLEAYRPASSDGDAFVFTYSTDGATWYSLVTVASGTEQVYTASVPTTVSGTVYVRVVDTDRNWDRTSLDAIYIDEMYFETDTGTAGPPVADFSGTPTTGYEPLTVQFTDLSTGGPTSWSWDFGDGSGTSAEQNPSYTYSVAGTYTVTLTVANSYGSDVMQKVDFITVTVPPPPTADFSGTPTSGYAPLAVQFTDLSTGAPTSWSWDFGDGSGTSTEQNPSYTYSVTGTYTVTLTVANAYGSDLMQKVDYITVQESSGFTLYVSDIVATRKSAGPNQFAQTYVTIVDQDGSPVSGAYVYGFFNYPDATVYSAQTGTDGVAFIEGGKTQNVSDFCFEVTDVVLGGYTYDSAANLVTRSCESGDLFSAGGRGFAASSDVPEAIDLMQNYPNPFNPVTTVAFGLPSPSRVRLDIYTVKGELVETLVSGSLGAGYHTYEWNARNAASGIYFYRLITDEKVVTKKMVLMR